MSSSPSSNSITGLKTKYEEMDKVHHTTFLVATVAFGIAFILFLILLFRG